MSQQIRIKDMKVNRKSASAMMVVEPAPRQGEKHYRYTIITRENAAELHLLPSMWVSHPDWNVFLRSDIEYRGYQMGMGGVTFDAAKSALDEGICSTLDVAKAIGAESATPIDRERGR